MRYEIIGRGKATKYFQIDSDTGVLRVTNDLKKEVDTEYQVSEQTSNDSCSIFGKFRSM